MVTSFPPKVPSFAAYILKSKSLTNFFMPLSKTYARLAGYRQMGLRYDDLLPEENNTMQKALGRLTERQSYDRAFRIRTAMQCSATQHLLPRDQWLTEKDDVRYITPLAEEIEQETKEKDEFDSLKVTR